MNHLVESATMPQTEECVDRANENLETGSSTSSTVELIKSRGDIEANADVVECPRGLDSFFTTVGLMVVVLMIALDNYITGINPILFLLPC